MNVVAAIFMTVVIVLGAVSLASIGYLLLLLAAAFFGRQRRRNATPPNLSTSFAIIVPAHNEELVIGAALQSLTRLEYPKNRTRVIVVADNCTDATAQIARSSGVEVIERFDEAQRGKGFALAYAVDQLLARHDCPDAVVIIDADTFVAKDFLAVMSTALSAARTPDQRIALQGRYGVLNAEQGWRPALMAGAFDLFNHVKPLGREALGLSAGLKGNGMVFTRSLLEVAPFTGASITEDIDYGLDLLLNHGVRVGYVPGALVKAQMPVTAAQSKSQRERWEHGRFKLMRERVPVLLASALRRGDIRLADAAVDLLLPPLAEIAGLLLIWTALTVFGLSMHWFIGPPTVYAGALLLGIIGFVTYIVGGFKAADAPREAYAALLKAPGYAIWKFATLAAKPFSKRRKSTTAPAGAEDWVRTERIRMSSPDGTQAP